MAFWAACPRREKKETALTAWLDLAPSPELIQQIHDALRLQNKYVWPKVEPHAIPHPASWLGASRWEDEVVERPQDRPRGQAQRAFDVYIAEELEKERHDQGSNGSDRGTPF